MSAQMVEIDNDLDQLIREEANLLVEFYSPSCGPCKMLNFILHDVADDLSDDYVIAQINYDEAKDLVDKYEIEGYPTVLIYKDGETFKRFSGIRKKDVILDYIEGA